MQTQKLSVIVVLIAGLITSLPSDGQTKLSCVYNKPPLKQEQTRHSRLYFLNRNRVPISACPPSQDACEQQLAYKLGEFFFAAEENGQQFLLGKYSRNMGCFTELVGWVDAKYLIQGIRPIRVGEAVTRFPEIADQNEAANQPSSPETAGQTEGASKQGFNPANRLELKSLSHLEEGRFLPRFVPDKDGDKNQLGLEALRILWRYVYAIDKVEGELWYLVGQSNLLTRKRLDSIRQTDANLTAEAQKVLLGWIQQKTVMEWPTNQCLAYNTLPAAVDERLQTNEAGQYKQLAQIYLEPREDSEVMATESVDLWQDYLQGKARTDKTWAWPDQIGLAPNVPRFFVQGYDKQTGMYRVGFFGRGGEEEQLLDEVGVAESIGKVQKMINQLRTIDIVFLIDRSRSMVNAFVAVKEFLNKFSEELGKLNQEGERYYEIQVQGETKQIEMSLDIRVSLALYAHQVEPIFKNLSLLDKKADIEAKIDKIRPWDFYGGREATYHALSEVLKPDSGYWREEQREQREENYAKQRLIILLTDEPGQPKKRTEDQAHEDQAMAEEQALVVQRLQQIVQELNPFITQLNEEMGTELAVPDYRDYLTIWAIFSKRQHLFEQFKNNLQALTHTEQRVSYVKRFARMSSQQQAQRALIQGKIFETIIAQQKEIEEQIKYFARCYLQQQPNTAESDNAGCLFSRQTTTTPTTADIPIPTVMHEVTLRQLMAKLGIGSHILSALNSLPFSIGYAKRHQSQHSHETFREELVIGVRDLKRLRGVMEGFVESLDHAFEMMNSAGTKQDIIGAALLYAVAVATGDEEKTKTIERMSPRKLKRYVKRWLNSGEVQDKTLAELIGIYDQIPTATQSILGLKVADILSLPEDEEEKDHLVKTCREESRTRCEQMLTFAEHRELLDQKLACIKYILHGKTVPTDVNRCRAHRGEDKVWRYSPPGSYQDFIYLPRYLVP